MNLKPPFKQTSLVNSQKLEISTTNSTLTEAIKEFQDLKDNPAELSQEAINSRVNDILKQKDFESHWQRELDKTAQKLVFKNLRRTPATANLNPSKVFEEYIDLNRTKPSFNSHLLLCSFGSIEGITLIKRHAPKLPRGVSVSQLPTPPTSMNSSKSRKPFV